MTSKLPSPNADWPAYEDVSPTQAIDLHDSDTQVEVGASQNQPSPIPIPNASGALGIVDSRLDAGRDINIVVNGNTPMLRQLKNDLKPVGATHNSSTSAGVRRTGCFEGTRVQVLDDIGNWMTGESANQASVYVLDGVAGIGKSTIAQTVAERAAKAGILGADFFFSKDDGERNTGRHFCCTIAYHLACRNPEIGSRILDAMNEDPCIEQKDIYVQFSFLILTPLRKLAPIDGPPTLVVIDALDECEQEDAKVILNLLGENAENLPNLKFFITSRPEFHITAILDRDSNHKRFYLHDIEKSVVQNDIRLYLDFSLSPEQVCKVFPEIQPPWQPTEDEKEKLYGICGTLFIIASTAKKFVLDDKFLSPAEPLSYLLDGVSSADYSGSKRTDVLDRTYIQIIRSASSHCFGAGDNKAMESWRSRYQTVVGAIVVLQYPLPCQTLAYLLDMKMGDVEGTLRHLHSIVAPSGQDRVFQVHHKSFPDFIISKDRIKKALGLIGFDSDNVDLMCSDFLIDIELHHRNLTKQCFRVMRNNLKQNMCGLTAPDWYRERDDIEHFLENNPISREVCYACMHWASHLHAGRLDAGVEKGIFDWALRDMLAWLETLSILNQIDSAHDSFKRANEVIKRRNPASKEVRSEMMDYIAAAFRRFVRSNSTQGSVKKEEHTIDQMLRDGYRFVQHNAALLKLSPMHVYRSAIPFTPTHTSTYRHYGGLGTVSLVSGSKTIWDPQLVTLRGHFNRVTCIGFSPDGSRLASGSSDCKIQLWDGNTGSHISTLRGHAQPIKSIAFSPDGSRLVSLSDNRIPSVRRVPVDINGKSRGTIIRLWDGKTGSHISTLQGHDEWVTCIEFSPDGSQLASGSASKDMTIQFWDGRTGAHISTNLGHTDVVACIAFSPDGSRLASGSGDNTLRLWDGKAGSCITVLRGHRGRVSCVAYSADGFRLASGSADRTIRLWDGKTGSHISTLQVHGYLERIAFSSDGSRLASLCWGNKLWIWDGKTGRHISTLRGHKKHVLSFAFSPNGSRLASGSLDGTLRLWDGKTGSHISTLHTHGEVVTSVTFSPDGSRLASGSEVGGIALWGADTDSCNPTLRGHKKAVTCIAFSPDGSTLASGSDDALWLWDGKTGSRISTYTGISVSHIAFCPDGTRLALVLQSERDQSELQLRNGKTGSRICSLRGHTAVVHCIAFSPDGSRLASGSGDKTLRLWDGKTGSLIYTLLGHDGPVTFVAFSPDGSRLVSRSWDNTLRVWGVKSGSHIATVEGLGESYRHLSFSPDGSRLASTSGETIQLFKLDGKTASLISTLQGHSARSVTFSPDSSRLVSVCDKRVNLWDAKTGRPIDTFWPSSYRFLESYIIPSKTTAHNGPSRMIMLVWRTETPLLSGIVVSTKLEDASELNFEFFPICWFPVDIEPSQPTLITRVDNRLAVNYNGTMVALGCDDGRVILLDISLVPLP